MIANAVRQLLDTNEARYHVVPHPPRFTAQEVAHAAHVSGRHFAKTVILRADFDGRPVGYLMAVLPAHEVVDLTGLGRLLDARIELASEQEIARLFPDLEMGAIPPLGELGGIPVVADACLTRASWIVFHGGRLTDLIEMRWEDYAALAMPSIVDLGIVPRASAA